MVTIRHKKTGTVGSASRFNMSSLSEILVNYDSGEADSDYQSNWDVQLPDGSWKDLRQAFKDHDVVTDNYNSRFHFPATLEDRERGFTL